MNNDHTNTLIRSKEGTITYIKLNRPTLYNSFNREMSLALQKLLDECEEDNTRCVVLTGEGKAFSAGQDLKEVTDPAGPPMRTIVMEHYNPIIQRLRRLPVPVIAAVNGVAAGAGANIALACDIVIAKESAYFMQAFSHIGLIPDSGGTFHLPRLIGWQRASAIMMLGEKVFAKEAMTMGMIYKAIPDAEWDTYVKSLAEKLASMPTVGLALTKEALNSSQENNLFSQLDAEERLQIKAGETEDYAEGVRAFLEKRPANFTGR